VPGGFPARYEGTCAVCHEAIVPGQLIHATRGWDEHTDAMVRQELGLGPELLRALRWQHVRCSAAGHGSASGSTLLASIGPGGLRRLRGLTRRVTHRREPGR
jgi:hypothetical protein